MLLTTEFAVTCLFTKLLRLATNVARNRGSFSTFAHIALNVYERSQRLVVPLGYTLQDSVNYNRFHISSDLIDNYLYAKIHKMYTQTGKMI